MLKNQGILSQPSEILNRLLRTHPNSWLHWIQLHALLWELACFTAIGQDLQWLAQQGGDGLIYGLAHPSIHIFLNHYMSLMHAISHQLHVIHGFASSTYKEKKRAASQHPWLTSFTKADALYHHIETDRQRCHTYAMTLATQTASGIDNHRQRKMQARTATILERVDAFSQRMGSLFGEPKTKTPDAECTHHESLSNQPAVLAKPLFYTASKPRKLTAISDNTPTRHRRTRPTPPSLIANPTDFTLPDYIQNFIVNFNAADEVAHTHAQWQTYFKWQKDKGGKGKPALLRMKPEKQAIWLLDETNAFVRESRCAQESFLYAFEQNWHLPTASEFVIQITHAIQQFEANHLDHAKPHGFVAWVLGEDQLWETRHHELFYLKYLCVKAASSETDARNTQQPTAEQILHAFIDTFNQQSPWKYFSDYRKLRDALLAIEATQTTPGIELTPSLDVKGESEKASVSPKNQPRNTSDDDEDIIWLDDWRDADESQDGQPPPFYDSLFDDDDSLLVSHPVKKRNQQKATLL